MTLKEFFSAVGGDYETVSSRLPGDALIYKFVKKFPQDQSFADLCLAWEESNVQNAFLAAHTLKGTAANLGLDALAHAAGELTEALRNAAVLPPLSAKTAVEEAYKTTVSNIALLGENE